MVQRVQPLKLESPESGGGDLDQFPTSVNRNEDYLDCRGVAFQSDTSNDELVTAYRGPDDQLRFRDGVVTNPVTLQDLLEGDQGFGGDYAHVTSLGMSTTTSNLWQDKVVLVSEPLTGVYLVTWHVALNNDGDLGWCRLYNSTDMEDLGGELSFGGTSLRPDATYMWLPMGSIGELVFTGSSKTLRLQWRSQINGRAQNVRDAHVMIWKVHD